MRTQREREAFSEVSWQVDTRPVDLGPLRVVFGRRFHDLVLPSRMLEVILYVGPCRPC